jgi:hypothetical protein
MAYEKQCRREDGYDGRPTTKSERYRESNGKDNAKNPHNFRDWRFGLA